MILHRYRVNPRIIIFCFFIFGYGFGFAQQKYLDPPEAAKELFASRPMPRVSLSPNRRHLLIAQRNRFQRIQDLALRVVALAGVRINPFNNGSASPTYYVRIEIKEISSGQKFLIGLPNGPKRFSLPIWSPDGKQFAFLQYNRDEINLWVVEAAIQQLP